ncbi:MAG TPA: ankyrin repeat domain-containing protein [Acetobacteraceae bacterium]|nr:ankyrin repeat domain-containing protein [Acetobacteraceae bacterium]
MRAVLVSSVVMLAGLGLALPAGSARADVLNVGRSHAKAAAQPQSQKLAPPPAIPGAQSQPGAAAPADHSATDMPPNEALFDAIDRGDITAARDALNRGADLDARDPLGMTPVDLSIDLGRNDITFLLLSLRGSVGGDGAPPAAQAASSVQPSPAHHHRQGRVEAEIRRRAPRNTAPPVADEQASLGGGTPVPQAGFLGFGGHP